MGKFLTGVEELMLILLIVKAQKKKNTPQTQLWLDPKCCPYIKEMRSQTSSGPSAGKITMQVNKISKQANTDTHTPSEAHQYLHVEQ